MNRPAKTAFSASLAVLLLGLAVFVTPPGEDLSQQADAYVLKADSGKKWYRGNLHTHSLWSDGDDYLETIALWYRDRDYDFLCFTDHNTLATNKDRWVDISKKATGKDAYEKLKKQFPDGWVEERMANGKTEVRLKTYEEVVAKVAIRDEFLLIQGEEVTDRFGRLPVHLCATNIKELIPPLHGESVSETIDNNVNALIAQRERTKQPMFIHLNHPNFGYGVTAEDLMRVRGEKFFEVYNGHPGVRNSGDQQHASTERMWDIILTKRLAELNLSVMYGLATDDGHNYHQIPSRKSEPGRGWVMVLAGNLQAGTLVEAMEKGDFYSSSGVELAKVISSPKGLDVEVLAARGVKYRIDFVGTRAGYDPESKPVLDAKGKEVNATRIYSNDIGATLKTVNGSEASYQFSGDEIYVRAIVTSTKKHPNPSEVGEFERAWAQPVVGPAAR
jgi:hypothetical protein